jgi:hypothetical protein
VGRTPNWTVIGGMYQGCSATRRDGRLVLGRSFVPHQGSHGNAPSSTATRCDRCSRMYEVSANLVDALRRILLYGLTGRRLLLYGLICSESFSGRENRFRLVGCESGLALPRYIHYGKRTKSMLRLLK